MSGGSRGEAVELVEGENLGNRSPGVGIKDAQRRVHRLKNKAVAYAHALVSRLARVLVAAKGKAAVTMIDTFKTEHDFRIGLGLLPGGCRRTDAGAQRHRAAFGRQRAQRAAAQPLRLLDFSFAGSGDIRAGNATGAADRSRGVPADDDLIRHWRRLVASQDYAGYARQEQDQHQQDDCGSFHCRVSLKVQPG